MDKINVLVFPAGEINAIELHTALSSCVNIKLYGAASVDRHGPYVFKNYISGLPMIAEDGFIDHLNNIINDNSIDLIFPTHDSVSLFFAENKDKINANILTPDLKTAKICRSKKDMYALFHGNDFIPKIYQIGKKIDFPVFIKPDEGQGGKGAFVIKNQDDLDALDELDQYVISEYLPGDELTIDCITDINGKLRGVFPRARQRVFCGVSVAGKALKASPEILEIAHEINRLLNFLGLWFFQLKQDIKGEYKLMEISTRVAGGMCLTRARGVNLPLLSVYTALGYEIEVSSNNYAVQMDRTLINRYKTDIAYQHVYLDFDDTLVCNGEVNLDMIRFIYQCLNKGKNIHLLTKHEQDISSSLRKYHIDRELFSTIKQIPIEDLKYSHIDHKDAIFIDNAYQERELVTKNCGIPVFDLDTIEVILDWRR